MISFSRTAMFALFLAVLFLGLPRALRARPVGRDPALAFVIEQAEETKAESHERLFKLINFLILVGALAYFLRKPMGEFFRGRSEEIRRSLEEGRKALEASQAQLAAVEEKLRGLDREIAAFNARAVQEMERERERLRQGAAEEAEKVLQAARAQIEATIRGARVELQALAAQHAVGFAEHMLLERLDDRARRRLTNRFMEGLKGN